MDILRAGITGTAVAGTLTIAMASAAQAGTLADIKEFMADVKTPNYEQFPKSTVLKDGENYVATQTECGTRVVTYKNRGGTVTFGTANIDIRNGTFTWVDSFNAQTGIDSSSTGGTYDADGTAIPKQWYDDKKLDLEADDQKLVFKLDPTESCGGTPGTNTPPGGNPDYSGGCGEKNCNGGSENTPGTSPGGGNPLPVTYVIPNGVDEFDISKPVIMVDATKGGGQRFVIQPKTAMDAPTFNI